MHHSRGASGCVQGHQGQAVRVTVSGPRMTVPRPRLLNTAPYRRSRTGRWARPVASVSRGCGPELAVGGPCWRTPLGESQPRKTPRLALKVSRSRHPLRHRQSSPHRIPRATLLTHRNKGPTPQLHQIAPDCTATAHCTDTGRHYRRETASSADQSSSSAERWHWHLSDCVGSSGPWILAGSGIRTGVGRDKETEKKHGRG